MLTETLRGVSGIVVPLAGATLNQLAPDDAVKVKAVLVLPTVRGCAAGAAPAI